MPTTPSGFRYPASSDAPNVPQSIQNLALDIETFVAARRTWTSFTPTLTSTGTTPVMLSANRIGRYRRDGKLIVCEMWFKWTNLGTGEGSGSGDYRFSLPAAVSSFYPPEFGFGSGSYVDAGVATYSGTAQLIGSASVQLALSTGKAGASSPATPQNTDSYSFSLSYEAAT